MVKTLIWFCSFSQKDRIKSRSVASLVLWAASGCLRTRFSSILASNWDGFSMLFGVFFRITFALFSVRESFSNGVFGRNFSHVLRIKSAKVCQTSHVLLSQDRPSHKVCKSLQDFACPSFARTFFEGRRSRAASSIIIYLSIYLNKKKSV